MSIKSEILEEWKDREPTVDDCIMLFARTANILPRSLWFSELSKKQKIMKIYHRINKK